MQSLANNWSSKDSRGSLTPHKKVAFWCFSVFSHSYILPNSRQIGLFSKLLIIWPFKHTNSTNYSWKEWKKRKNQEGLPLQSENKSKFPLRPWNLQQLLQKTSSLRINWWPIPHSATEMAKRMPDFQCLVQRKGKGINSDVLLVLSSTLKHMHITHKPPSTSYVISQLKSSLYLLNLSWKTITLVF